MTDCSISGFLGSTQLQAEVTPSTKKGVPTGQGPRPESAPWMGPLALWAFIGLASPLLKQNWRRAGPLKQNKKTRAHLHCPPPHSLTSECSPAHSPSLPLVVSHSHWPSLHRAVSWSAPWNFIAFSKRILSWKQFSRRLVNDALYESNLFIQQTPTRNSIPFQALCYLPPNTQVPALPYQKSIGLFCFAFSILHIKRKKKSEQRSDND